MKHSNVSSVILSSIIYILKYFASLHNYNIMYNIKKCFLAMKNICYTILYNFAYNFNFGISLKS